MTQEAKIMIQKRFQELQLRKNFLDIPKITIKTPKKNFKSYSTC